MDDSLFFYAYPVIAIIALFLGGYALQIYDRKYLPWHIRFASIIGILAIGGCLIGSIIMFGGFLME